MLNKSFLKNFRFLFGGLPFDAENKNQAPIWGELAEGCFILPELLIKQNHQQLTVVITASNHFKTLKELDEFIKEKMRLINEMKERCVPDFSPSQILKETEVAVPHFLKAVEETIDMSRLIIKNELIPLLTMSPIKEPFEVQRRLTKVQGNFMAKAALETAIWDLYARRKNVSFREIFKSTKTELAVGISLGIHTDSAKLLKQARMYVSQGYTRLKLKIKPDYDIEPLTLLRKEFPHLLLMADANSAYTLKDLPVLLKLDRLNLAMIEQPFNQRDFIEHAYLQKQLKTPICLDENIRTLNDVKTAHTLGSCRGINLKIPRVGGIAEALSIVTFCREHNLTVWLGGMFESGVGRCLNIQFASQNDFTFPGDISASDRYYYDDIIKNKACLTDGKLAVPLGKGNGAVLDQEKIERYCYKKELLFS